MVALGFGLIIGAPFLLGVGLIELRIPPLTKAVVAIAPVGLLALANAEHVFWIGDLGAAIIAVLATGAWVLGLLLSGSVRAAASAARRVARV